MTAIRALLVIAAVLALAGTGESRVFSRCALAQTLVNTYGFSKADIGEWICLAEHESRLNTSKVSPTNRNGSKDYGLFQINSKYWCRAPGDSSAKDCNVSCTQLTTDDISKSVTCAKKIFARHGFNAWYGWLNNCRAGSTRDKNRSFVQGCRL